MWSHQGGWTGSGWGRPVAVSGGGGGSLLSLDFTGGSLPSGATLTRSTTGNYFNASDILTSAAINAARFDYFGGVSRGVLVEAAATNGTNSPEAFDAVWSLDSTTVTANNTTAPDGTSNADKLVETATTTRHIVYQSSGAVAGSTYTISVFVKKGTRRYGFIKLANTGTFGCFFDFDTASTYSFATGGSTVAGSSITSVGNGWYRVTATGVPTTSSFFIIGLSDRPDDTTGTFQFGDPSYLGTTSDFMYLWGAQCELSSAMSTYYVGTRSADALSITIPSGGSALAVTFDDNSTQNISVSPGAYTLTTSLNRPRVKTLTVT